MTAYDETFPLLHHGHRSDDFRVTREYASLEAENKDTSDHDELSFLGDMIEVDLSSDEKDDDDNITVGLSQITLFPSRKLKKEEKLRAIPDSECVLLSLCSICLDDDQMLQLAHTAEAYQEEQNNGKKRAYIPPPVTWSQPAIIVPPEEEYSDEEGVSNNPPPRAGERQVQFDATSHGAGKGQKTMLLHGRVARAMGIKSGDRVAVQLAGQSRRQIVKAAVDDRASFNVVLEADWSDVLLNHTQLTNIAASKLSNRTNRQDILRSVSLMVADEEDGPGETSQKARFYLTPFDRLREGILYFEGSMVINHPRHIQGLASGTGFCIYSCNSAVACEEDESSYSDDSAPAGRRVKLPRKQTELVASYRYLGRPFCANHAEYAALIEGLEWLFRFQFDKVYLVGAPQVIRALRRRRSSLLHRSEKESSDDDSTVKLPQLSRANDIAQGMIDKARKRGVRVIYHPAKNDESWEAGELADKAVDKGRNETHVCWDHILETTQIDPKLYGQQTSANSNTTKSENGSPSHWNTVDSEDEWSLLKGEEVLDEEFLALENIIGPAQKEPNSYEGDNRFKRSRQVSFAIQHEQSSYQHGTVTRQDEPAKAIHPKNKEGNEEEGQQEDTPTMQEVRARWQQYAASNNKDATQTKKEKEQDPRLSNWLERGSKVGNVLRPEEEKKDNDEEESPQTQEQDLDTSLDTLNQVGRGNARWQKIARAARLRRRKREKKSQSDRSDKSVVSQQSGDDDRSTWMISPTQSTEEILRTMASLATRDKEASQATPDIEEKVANFSDDEEDTLGKMSFTESHTSEGDTTKSCDGDATKPHAAIGNTICFMIDLEFLKSAQNVADDVARIFRKETQESDYFSADDEEKETSAMAQPTKKNHRSSVPRMRTYPTKIRSQSPLPKRNASFKHYDQSFAPASRLTYRHRKQYGDV